MRLGVVMTGNGALAAANAGVLRALEQRGLEPCCVCGLQGGAWPAALWIAGHDAAGMHAALLQAQRMGGRMLKSGCTASALLRRGRTGLMDARRMEHLLLAQAGQRMLCLCPRPGLLLCRMAQTGRRTVFASRAFAQENGIMLSMQASVSFAARAAMTMPPFLEPVQWMGSALIADHDVGFACRQLLALGAQRVLVVMPSLSMRHTPDAMDLAAMACNVQGSRLECAPVQGAAALRVDMPDQVGALGVDRLETIAAAGETAAQRELDRVFESMGMAFCRVLPFKKPYAQTGAR